MVAIEDRVNDDREQRRKILRELSDACKSLSPAVGHLGFKERYAGVRTVVERVIQERYPLWPEDRRRWYATRTVDMMVGYGPLEPLLADDDVTDITANGIDDIWIDLGGGLELTDLWFVDEEELKAVTDRLLDEINRRVDEKSPMSDARLPSGERVNIVIPPASVNARAVTIRRFPRAYTPEELFRKGTFDADILDLLAALVRARANMVISGGTGSGKTTLLNSLTTFIPVTERIVSIEDISELALFERRPNVVALETRPASVEGTGEIGVRALVRNALRMRPDRIIVGEVRGPETLDMLQAMNTGHEGSITTVHANSSADAIPRLLTLAAMTELSLSFEALQAQVRTAVDVIVHLARGRDGIRRLVEVDAVSSDDGRGVGLDKVVWLGHDANGSGKVGYSFAPTLPARLERRLVAAGEAIPRPFDAGD